METDEIKMMNLKKRLKGKSLDYSKGFLDGRLETLKEVEKQTKEIFKNGN